MTVSELIKLLESLPEEAQDLNVWVEAEERSRPLETVQLELSTVEGKGWALALLVGETVI